jgi:hypothetical protein
MNLWGKFSFEPLKSIAPGAFVLSNLIMFLSGACPVAGDVAFAQSQSLDPLSANDVSWLFPPPKKAEDFAKLIAMADLTVANAQDATKRDRIWSEVAFQQFIGIAASPATLVEGTTSRIGLPVEIQSIDAWFVAGVRIDAGAPGLSSEVRDQFGQAPQIRLILQPVTRNPDGTPKVFDIAAHLIFDFTLRPEVGAQAGCSPRATPDLVALKAIVAELADLRTKLSQGKLGANSITTAGVSLGVHPG